MARYKRQINIALDQLDQGLARVYSMVKQGNNLLIPKFSIVRITNF